MHVHPVAGGPPVTRHERRIVAQLLEATAGLEPEEALVRLLAMGPVHYDR